MWLMWVWLISSLCQAAAALMKFSVLGADAPVFGHLGAPVVLPCSVSPSFSAKEHEVRWYRPQGYNSPVLLYNNLQIQQNPADAQYSTRASLVGELERGNVSLRLNNLTVADEGEYVCNVDTGTWYDKTSILLHLKAVGSPVLLSSSEAEGGKVNVTCVSHGWLPQPTLTWRDGEGRERHNKNVWFSKDTQGLVSVSSWLLISPAGSEWLSCSVGLSEQEKRESRVLLLSRAATQSCSEGGTGVWREAFIITLVIFLLIIISAVSLFILLQKKGLIQWHIKRRHLEITEEETPLQDVASSGAESHHEPHEKLTDDNNQLKVIDVAPGAESHHKQHNKPSEDKRKPMDIKTAPESGRNEAQLKSNPTACVPIERQTHNAGTGHSEEQSTSDSTACVSEEIQTHNAGSESHSRPAEYNKPVDKGTAAVPADWSELKGYKANITLEGDKEFSYLRVTHQGKRVHCTLQDVKDDRRAFLLSKERLSSGRHYWEVKVWPKPERKLSWCVGVASDTAERLYKTPLTPKNEFWVLCYERDQGVYVNTDPRISVHVCNQFTKLGVFLDCEKHTLSFYDADAKSHLYTFDNVVWKESLCALVGPGVLDKEAMIIC